MQTANVQRPTLSNGGRLTRDEFKTRREAMPDLKRAHWQILKGSDNVEQTPADGIIRVEAFPGLWLDVYARLNGNRARTIDVVNDGLHSPEHAAFVALLASRKIP